MTDPIDIMAGTARQEMVRDAKCLHAGPCPQDVCGCSEDIAWAVLRALDAAGYAIVPKEPTDAMVRSAGTFFDGPDAHYTAMIEAGRVKP